MKTLYNADCRQILASIEPETIDLTVTSPPYDNLRLYNKSSTWSFSIFTEVPELLWKVTAEGGCGLGSQGQNY